MLFQRYMTGRGNLGYGFRAQTTKVPITSYLKLRASDTGDTKRMLLEIMTTSYHEIAAIGSCFDREQSNGYTDILFADPNGGAEWEEILDNPGRLLYLPHISKADFLETSNKGKTVSLGAGEEMALPQISHKYDQRFHVDEDTLADLVADVWYAASMRLTAADRPGGWPVVNICLTEEDERDDTLEIGREFYCNVLMPALPRSLRSVVSVCIGGRYSDVSNAVNGGAAAVLITLPDEKQEILPGTYVLTTADNRHQSLNPFQNTESWRQFGRAILNYAKNGMAGDESYLNDFFAAAERIASKPEYQSLRYLTANWPYAFLLFNAHQSCEAALQQTGDFDESVSAEEIQANFEENIWESADPSFLKEFGFSETEARNCYVWLEKHLLAVMLGNRRIAATRERYEEMARRAFTLQQIENVALQDELQQEYDELLLRGTAASGSNAFELLLELMAIPEFESLFNQQKNHLALLMKGALDIYGDIPTDEHLRILAEYARRGDEECSLVTDYAIDLLERDVDYSRLKLFRSVQRGDVLDHALIENFRKYDQMRRCTEPEFRASLRAYAETAPAAGAMPENELKTAFASVINEYIKDNTYVYRNQLDLVRRAFADIGMEKSPELMDALTTCMENEDQPFAAGDVAHAIWVLGSDDAACADRMIGVLRDLFENALPDMFEQGKRTVSATHVVLDNCWPNCINRTAGEMREKLRGQLAECLCDYVAKECESMRYQMPNVVQAFKELGLETGKNEIAMQALCACMEVTGEGFTRQDADDILPVLRSAKPEAGRMAQAVLKTFADALPELMEDQSNPEEHPWKVCIRENKPSEAQQQLALDMRDHLLTYANEKPDRLVSHLSRAMELLKAYGCTDPEQTASICCKVLQCQVKLLEEDAILSEQDYKVINGLELKNVSEDSKEALASALHALFRKQLPVMAQDDKVCERWNNCLKNKHFSEQLKVKTQQTFAEYVDKHTKNLGKADAVDCLADLLTIVDGLGWTNAEVVRNAIAAYFCNLQRDKLSENEISILLDSCTKPQNREIIAGLGAVFCRSIPRLLEAGGVEAAPETGLWVPVVQAIDMRENFHKTVLEIVQKENAVLDETFIVSLISFGDALKPLLETATEQAISVIEARKAKLSAAGSVASELLSMKEHETVLSAVRTCAIPRVLYQYIDLLAYEPSDAENEENEKLLRKKMKEMRESLFRCMNVEAATYAVRKSPLWQAEIQQALLGKLRSMTQTDGLTFQHLCELPTRWALECQNWNFVQFTDLSRYVPDREQLETAVRPGAQRIIQQALLEELKKNPLQGADGWYAALIQTLIAQRSGADVTMLAAECDTPEAVEDLLKVLNQTHADVAPETAEVLNRVLYGGKDENVLTILNHLRELGGEAMAIGVTLLRKAVFGKRSDRWKDKWDASDCSSRIPMAAICYLADTKKMWNEFFCVVLEDASMDKKAMAAGTDPVQALIFASSVLNEMGMTAEANDMVEQLKSYRREEYAYVRAIGRKRKELAALKDAAAWKATGAAENLHQLIFDKH